VGLLELDGFEDRAIAAAVLFVRRVGFSQVAAR
jgi:hypothetical protein